MNEKTATQVDQENYERRLGRIKQERFWQHPETLPEAIAKHYCSMALLALDLGKLLTMRRELGSNVDLDYLITTSCQQIMKAHLSDLGSEIVSPFNYQPQ